MKMYAVKETVIANLICCSIESEHGKVELVFEGWGDGVEYVGCAQFLERYVVDYQSDNLQLHECKDLNFCHGDFKQVVMNFMSCTPFIPYDWEEMAPTMTDYAEVYTLLASAVACINQKLFNS